MKYISDFNINYRRDGLPDWQRMTPVALNSRGRTDEASIMGLHASYRPISQNTLDDFIARWHSEDFWKTISRFREESTASGQEFYIGTEWSGN